MLPCGLAYSCIAGGVVLARPLKLCLRILNGGGVLAPDAPGRLPLLGHLLEVTSWPTAKLGIWDRLTLYHGHLGKTFRAVLGAEFAPIKVFHFISGPANVQHILKDKFESYGKGQDMGDVFEEFLGKGIFVVDGDRWKSQRKTAAAIFTKRNFSENMIHVFQTHARQLAAILKSQATKRPSQTIDLQRLFFALTVDAFCEIGFGVPWNSMGDEEGDTPQNSAKRQWACHFDSAQACIVGRFAYRPLWKIERGLWKCGLLPKSSQEGQFAESVRFMNAMVEKLLDDRLAEERKGSDLLSLFMEVTQDRTYLRDVIMSFVIAGRDTTACTLTWMFWELARHPAVVEKARDEVIQEAGVKAGDEMADFNLSYDLLNRLKFCTACVRETVRLHPPVPSDPKVAFEDDVLPDGSLISRGDFVFYGPYMMARDADNWGPDAAEWKPERWLSMDQEPSNFMNCAFQAGPRICLGRDFAILEAKAVLAQLLLSGLQWHVSEDYTPTYKYPSIVLPMADPGLPVTLHQP
eukprot:TRINITY_DN27554_c1_g2_i3.p1 TRINITY_DN27554_c1_g2~~TRINITY_DN27554_c1_g2_i3.p1  ORF type:complete len:520 (+),score=58.69 TRINITY_DN27554_c1_g2_i3:59-1618(+)